MRPAPITRSRLGMTAVPTSQIALAASGYLVLAASGRTTPIAVFSALSAFYLLLNTVGRGVVAALELELTRALAAARALGSPGARAARATVPRALLLVLGAAVAAVVAAPALLAVIGGPAMVGLLVAGTVTLAVSYAARGPLAAHERYGAYSATYGVEAGVCALGAIVLAATGVDDVRVWASVFVLAPAVAAAAVGLALLGHRAEPAGSGPALADRTGPDLPSPTGATRPDGTPAVVAVTLGGLLWSTLLFLASQGVWNLGAVVVTAREAGMPAVAAGFTAVAVLLRAPALAFPALQALLLPRVSAESVRGRRSLLRTLVRRRAGLLGAVAVVWMVFALVAVPPISRWVFGIEVLPGSPVVLALGLSALIGLAIQFLQTQLIADGRARVAAVAWALGLLVLLGGATLPVSAPEVAAAAQLMAVAVVAVVMAARVRRARVRGAG